MTPQELLIESCKTLNDACRNASELIDRLIRRIQELEAWQSNERAATTKMAIALLNAGYKGDGILDGIQWLAAQLARTKTAEPPQDHVFAVGHKNAVEMFVVASVYTPSQLPHAQQFCRQLNDENRHYGRPECWIVMKAPLLANQHSTEWETVYDNTGPKSRAAG